MCPVAGWRDLRGLARNHPSRILRFFKHRGARQQEGYGARLVAEQETAPSSPLRTGSPPSPHRRNLFPVPYSLFPAFSPRRRSRHRYGALHQRRPHQLRRPDINRQPPRVVQHWLLLWQLYAEHRRQIVLLDLRLGLFERPGDVVQVDAWYGDLSRIES